MWKKNRYEIGVLIIINSFICANHSNEIELWLAVTVSNGAILSAIYWNVVQSWIEELASNFFFSSMNFICVVLGIYCTTTLDSPVSCCDDAIDWPRNNVWYDKGGAWICEECMRHSPIKWLKEWEKSIKCYSIGHEETKILQWAPFYFQLEEDEFWCIPKCKQGTPENWFNWTNFNPIGCSFICSKHSNFIQTTQTISESSLIDR